MRMEQARCGAARVASVREWHPELTAAIRAAARLRRSTGPEGIEPILTPRERDRLLAIVPHLPVERRAALSRAIAGLQGSGAQVARGLVLRAAAARGHRLLADERAMGEVIAFAERLKGLGPERLRAGATVLDLDSTRNDSTFDPLVLWNRRGLIRDRVHVDGFSDNDGLFQRFTNSCGAAVLQMMLAEADPVLAFSLNEVGLTTDATDDPIATFQRELLDSVHGVALGRREAQLRSRLRNALGRQVRKGSLTPRERDALLEHALRQGPLTAEGQRALGRVRAAYEGFPDDLTLARLRRQRQPEDDPGIGTREFAHAIARHVSPVTGTRYAQTSPPEGFGRGEARPHLDRVARALERGIDVPFGIMEPAHWMLLTAVRGRKPKRSFLVTDPDGGRTAWVAERDLVSGAFADRQFQLSLPHERPYIDCFFLPA